MFPFTEKNFILFNIVVSFLLNEMRKWNTAQSPMLNSSYRNFLDITVVSECTKRYEYVNKIQITIFHVRVSYIPFLLKLFQFLLKYVFLQLEKYILLHSLIFLAFSYVFLSYHLTKFKYLANYVFYLTTIQSLNI